MDINLATLIDDAKCYQVIREIRWKDGVCCPHCQSPVVIKRGKDEVQLHRQRYECKSCRRHFDDLTNTIFALAPSTPTAVGRLLISDGIEPIE